MAIDGHPGHPCVARRGDEFCSDFADAKSAKSSYGHSYLAGLISTAKTAVEYRMRLYMVVYFLVSLGSLHNVNHDTLMNGRVTVERLAHALRHVVQLWFCRRQTIDSSADSPI